MHSSLAPENVAPEDVAPEDVAAETPVPAGSRAACPVGPGAASGRTAFRSDRAADRAMRWLLGIREPAPSSGAGAHRAFRVAVVISALRCTITYVAIPVLIPLLSLAGWIAGPVGLALCAIAAVNGVVSVRRFWRADHAQRWTYTAFIVVVFVILTISTWTEASRLVAAL
ncbi:hypothetical protein [Brachybacterium paraconglomeratum]|uniref:hypothetical protein n=1 Tax=Brachybacterium paraconglomeratum TaxID=173362 RepID=UPI001CD1E38C|nr:hypothetical protein [Brachybacterium paraconglomeratum]MCZ4326120.1 hypothetical protein [Brachybacterium paraconglomeratum]MDV3294506.1 hypothetical protein [Brachybacterium paraconglomeratum]